MWKNRIVSQEEVSLDEILFNPSNWRIHPARQQDAVDEALNKVGWVETVLVNLRTSEEWAPGDRNVKTLVDGHLRVTLAGRKGERTVPVTYVDLSPQEEDYVLATLDPLGSLAVADKDQLLSLVARQEEQTKATLAALRGAGLDQRKAFSHIDTEPSMGNAKATAQYGNENTVAKSSPSDREKYPLAIVLDRQGYEMWQIFKKSQGIARDTDALMSLLSGAVAEVNFD